MTVFHSPFNLTWGTKVKCLQKLKELLYLDFLAFLISLSHVHTHRHIHTHTHTQHIYRASAIILPPDFFLCLLAKQKKKKKFNLRQLWRAFFPPERSLTNYFTKLVYFLLPNSCHCLHKHFLQYEVVSILLLLRKTILKNLCILS